MCEAVEGDMFGEEEWANAERQEQERKEEGEEEAEGY